MRVEDAETGLDGRGERIRTSDPLVPNQVRYQTALRPEHCLRMGGVDLNGTIGLKGSTALAHRLMQALGMCPPARALDLIRIAEFAAGGE